MTTLILPTCMYCHWKASMFLIGRQAHLAPDFCDADRSSLLAIV